MAALDRNTLLRGLVLLGLIAMFLVVGAILLPPRGGKAMPRPVPAVSSR